MEVEVDALNIPVALLQSLLHTLLTEPLPLVTALGHQETLSVGGLQLEFSYLCRHLLGALIERVDAQVKCKVVDALQTPSLLCFVSPNSQHHAQSVYVEASEGAATAPPTTAKTETTRNHCVPAIICAFLQVTVAHCCCRCAPCMNLLLPLLLLYL